MNGFTYPLDGDPELAGLRQWRVTLVDKASGTRATLDDIFTTKRDATKAAQRLADESKTSIEYAHRDVVFTMDPAGDWTIEGTDERAPEPVPMPIAEPEPAPPIDLPAEPIDMPADEEPADDAPDDDRPRPGDGRPRPGRNDRRRR